MPDQQRPRVVIVGAGFGGLEAAKKLACKDLKLTILDRTNYHLFQPLLYQVATAALSPADIAAPVRAILHDCKNVEVILAEVQSVDVNKRVVQTGDLRIAYDYLILATGSRHSYFGHPEWERLAPGLKSLEDAVEIRRRILMAFEYAEKMYAENMADAAERSGVMTFLIVGAGFGGLEAAKKLACKDLKLTILDRTNYHLFQPLLYQVATAALSPADIAAPVRAILHDCKNVEVILAEVQSVDVNKRV
ncbi:MAG: hypothetical protein DME86_04900, partial [Verrucomicrobia bacterium]